MKNYCILLLFLLSNLCLNVSCTGQKISGKRLTEKDVVNGAERFAEYLPLLKGKKVAIVANQTSAIHGRHLVDTLKALGVHIEIVFAPEHGFRGESGAGEKIKSGTDAQTGLKVVSLYGKNLKPTAQDLQQVDIIIFDIQDVGARFYTFISTLQYILEAAAENKKSVLVLDRPNPNGFYVAGPLLDTSYRSFVGMTRIPVVHGMTVGEYAKMLKGERWFKNSDACKLTVIPCKGYTHRDYYQLPIPPSPNLPNMESVYLYPSLCFFEGTRVSVGRGTPLPFQWIGYPAYPKGNRSLTPVSMPHAAPNPPYRDTLCEGLDLRKFGNPEELKGQLRLEFLEDMYKHYPQKEKFFIPFFEKLAGTRELRKQLIRQEKLSVIYASWEKDIAQFKSIRKSYLLYPDFEN